MRKLTKAENRALDAYPMGCYPTANQRSTTDNLRDGYLEGYHQAEKDVKDALLKWANEELSFCKQMILNGNPGFEFKLSVYEKLIEKINTL